MIVRGPRPESGYYLLRNEIADDRSLSFAARGLLIHLLAKPDHWEVNVAALVNQTKEARIHTKRDAIHALLKELETVGYLVRRRTRGADGRLGKLKHVISEQKSQPQPAHPDTVKPTRVKTEGAVRTQTKSKDLSLPEGAHRRRSDEPAGVKARSKKEKGGKHPLWHLELSRLVGEGVSEKRARACLAKLVNAVGIDEALAAIEGARGDGETGGFLVNDIMRRVYAESGDGEVF